jgi:hypothetical protein
MKSKMGITLAAGILTLGLCASAFSARSKKEAQSSDSATPKAAPEIDRLKPYLGEWDYTETYPKSAFSPTEMKNTGVYSSKLGPGGNSLVNHFLTKGAAGDAEGLIVMTWDRHEKAYKSYMFANDFPGAVVLTGQFEGDALVLRGEFLAGDANPKSIKMRTVTRFLPGGKLTSESYFTMPDKPEVMMERVDAQKK